ncbi:hypothetical protein BGZ83_004263 [Gryganskiella cystojenkinii]|nr:hypothetical protein BGZ83_004263 [Gryganskiella cystojenkinii]
MLSTEKATMATAKTQITATATVSDTIPVIDFSLFRSDPAECGRQILVASQKMGFFYLKNHGVPQSLIDEMFETSAMFFQQPVKVKAQRLIGPDNIGYSPMKSETLDPEHQKVGDLKEAFNIRKYSIDDADSTGLFVLSDEKRQQDVSVFYKRLHDLAKEVLQCFAIGLEVPESAGGAKFFDKSHTWEEHAGTTLRFLHYPSQPGDPNTPLAGRQGLRQYYGSITLLMQKDIAGLEVQASRGSYKKGEPVPWVAAPVIPNTILVNIADHLQMWTNGLLKSTKHRVMYNPQQIDHSRYSIACFIHANNDTKLDPIPTKLVPTEEMRREAIEFEEARHLNAGDYLTWRLNRSYNYNQPLEEAVAK